MKKHSFQQFDRNAVPGHAYDFVPGKQRITFVKLDIIRITGVYYAPNKASGRVLEKVGFEYEGTRKNGVAKGDKIYDLCMTGLLKEKFDGNH